MRVPRIVDHSVHAHRDHAFQSIVITGSGPSGSDATRETLGVGGQAVTTQRPTYAVAAPNHDRSTIRIARMRGTAHGMRRRDARASISSRTPRPNIKEEVSTSTDARRTSRRSESPNIPRN